MRVVLQRVKRASVTVEGSVTGAIGRGLMMLIGIDRDDTEDDLIYMAEKCLNLRIFSDASGKMNLSLLDVKGEVLAVSQFTLLGDTRKGRRPSYINAAAPDKARAFYQAFVERIKSYDVKVACGVFGAMMDVELINEGPVTLIVESKPKNANGAGNV